MRPVICRREFLKEAVGSAAVLAMCGSSVLTQTNTADWQRWVDQGWQAFHQGNHALAVDCFLRARDRGRLREWEYFALSRSLAALEGRIHEAVAMADEGFRVWHTPAALGTRALACFDNGDAPSALKDLAVATKMNGADTKSGPLMHAYATLASLQIEFSIYLDFEDFYPPGQRLYRRNGYYTCYLPRSEPWQKVTILGTSGAERIEEWRDENDNQALKIWAKDDRPVETTVSVIRSPWYTVPPRGSGSYKVPASVKKYLGKTQGCDPTTDLVRRIAEPLRGATRLDTVRNVKAWRDDHIAGLDTGSASCTRYPGLPEVEAMLSDVLKTGMGRSNCGQCTWVFSVLLRYLGIASTGVFAKWFAPDPPRITNAGHVWAVYYEPAVGWLSLMEGGERIGKWPDGSVQFLRGDSSEHDALKDTEWVDSGLYWYYSSNGQTKPNYRVKSVRKITDV